MAHNLREYNYGSTHHICLLDRVWYCTQNCVLVHYEYLYYYYTRNFHYTINANKKEFNATTAPSILQTNTTINKHITTIRPAPQVSTRKGHQHPEIGMPPLQGRIAHMLETVRQFVIHVITWKVVVPSIFRVQIDIPLSRHSRPVKGLRQCSSGNHSNQLELRQDDRWDQVYSSFEASNLL